MHKTDKHSDSDCHAQQESAPPTATKRRPNGDKNGSKPHRLRFKSTTDRKKFLRPIEEMEGVSLHDSSNEDDCNVVTQSLMQLNATPPSESTDEEENHLDLHILVLGPENVIADDDVVMEEASITGANKENLDPLQSSRTNQDPLNSVSINLDPLTRVPTPQESVSHILLEGQAEVEVFNALPGAPDYASLSPSDTALLDGPNLSQVSTPQPKVLKIEENLFSPDPGLFDLGPIMMYPALPSSTKPSQSQPVVPLPHGQILINGVYYQPVPPPHNVVVATSSIPTTPMVQPEASTSAAPTPSVPATPVVQPPVVAPQEQPAPTTEPKVGLEFAMPEEPPFQKVERKSRKKSRSLSKSRSKSRSHSRARKNGGSKKSSTPQQPTTALETLQTRSGRGRGKKRPEMTNAPIIVPTTYSHLLHVPEPKGGPTVTFSKDAQLRKVEKTVQHLERLSTEASVPMEVVSKPSEATTIKAETPPAQEDSDVNLETGNVFVPTLPISDTEVLVYKRIA